MIPARLLDPYHPCSGLRQPGGGAREEPDRDQQRGHAQREHEEVDEPHGACLGRRHPGEHHREGGGAAGSGHDAGGGAQQEDRRVGPAAQPARPMQQPLGRAHRDHVQHGQREDDEQVGGGEAHPRVCAHRAEEGPAQPRHQAEQGVEHRKPGDIGEGQPHDARPRRLVPGSPGDDRRGDGDHRVDARRQAGQDAGPEEQPHGQQGARAQALGDASDLCGGGPDG